MGQGDARFSAQDVQSHHGGELGSAGVIPAQQRDVFPPFQPSGGGCGHDVPKKISSKKTDPGSLSFLQNVSIINPQYRALDFAKLTSYSYSSKIDKDNFNLALFSYGSLKHLLALSDGTLPSVSNVEFLSRLQHLVNVFDIVCLGSDISSFTHSSFTEGLNYDSRVLHDVETGVKEWSTISRSIDSTCWTYAKLLSKNRFHSDSDNSLSDSDTYTDSDYSGLDTGQRRCSSWNSFRKNGCQYEFLNPGKICKYVHSCSTCEANGVFGMPHKALECEDFVHPDEIDSL